MDKFSRWNNPGFGFNLSDAFSSLVPNSTSRHLMYSISTRRATADHCHWVEHLQTVFTSQCVALDRSVLGVDCSALPPSWVTKIILTRTPRNASLFLQGWSLDQMESRARSARLFGIGNPQGRQKPRRPSLPGRLSLRRWLPHPTPIPDQRIVLRTWKTSAALHGLSYIPPLLTIRRTPRKHNEFPC